MSAALENCPSCGFQNMPHTRFCAQCGIELARAVPQSGNTIQCPNCNKPNPEWRATCEHCGFQLPIKAGASSYRTNNLPADRPGCVTAYALLNALGAVLGGFTTIALGGWGVGLGIFILALGFTIVYGLWTMRSWGRWLVMIVLGLSIVVDIISFCAIATNSRVGMGSALGTSLGGIGLRSFILYWFVTHEADFR